MRTDCLNRDLLRAYFWLKQRPAVLCRNSTGYQYTALSCLNLKEASFVPLLVRPVQQRDPYPILPGSLHLSELPW